MVHTPDIMSANILPTRQQRDGNVTSKKINIVMNTKISVHIHIEVIYLRIFCAQVQYSEHDNISTRKMTVT